MRFITGKQAMIEKFGTPLFLIQFLAIGIKKKHIIIKPMYFSHCSESKTRRVIINNI